MIVINDNNYNNDKFFIDYMFFVGVLLYFMFIVIFEMVLFYRWWSRVFKVLWGLYKEGRIYNVFRRFLELFRRKK